MTQAVSRPGSSNGAAYFTTGKAFKASCSTPRSGSLGEELTPVQILQEGKPAWVVRTRNWKLRGGENRLPGLLGSVSIASLGKATRQGGPSVTIVQVRFL
ncbi:hypothetical protein V6N11_022540 [Hibiscus sabdariffa]|uniref:Uncharacterized protein n=1 Tax=Hibiscus sabdariffa TaxID=183260 RepID=A0ABR2TJH6_9ROSI